MVVLDEKLGQLQSHYHLGTTDTCCKFHAIASNEVSRINHLGDEGLYKTFMAIHPKVIKIFQSELK